MNFWKRECRMAIGKFGGAADEVGAGTVPLHIKFSCEKADTETSNSAKISVWNLNNEHLAQLDEKDCAVSLKAGYGNNLNLIFAGNVTKAVTTQEGADRRTEIEVVDSRVEIRDTYTSISLNGPVMTRQIYELVASQMGCAIAFSPSCEFKTVANGFVHVGRARDLLKRVTRMDGLKWSLQNGVIQVWKGSEPVSNLVYDITPESGMIGSPKRITSSATSEDTDNAEYTASQTADIGWEVTYLLNGAIGVNDYVHLRSREVEGYFRVQKVLIEGDNVEDVWQCTATLVEAKSA